MKIFSDIHVHNVTTFNINNVILGYAHNPGVQKSAVTGAALEKFLSDELKSRCEKVCQGEHYHLDNRAQLKDLGPCYKRKKKSKGGN